jgi:hypothetical protein
MRHKHLGGNFSGTVAVKKWDKPYLTTVRFDDLMTQNLIMSVISTFYQDMRPEPSQQFVRSLLVENNYKINAIKRSHQGSSVTFGQDRSIGSLQLPNGGIRIDCDYKTVAKIACFIKEMHVTGVEQVKTAIGKYDLLAVGFPCFHLGYRSCRRAELGANITERGIHSRSSKSRLQFKNIYGLSAYLANDDTGGQIGYLGANRE